MPEKIDVLRAKLRALRSTLERTPPKDKKSPATVELAENFNEVLKQAADLFPDLKGELPKPIRSHGAFSDMGRVDATYLDLEVLAEQVLALLDLAAEE